jgi:hypothetical protein
VFEKTGGVRFELHVKQSENKGNRRIFAPKRESSRGIDNLERCQVLKATGMEMTVFGMLRHVVR